MALIRMTMSAQTRGAFLKNAGIAVGVGASALIPSVAFADGAVSSATVQRARGVYGQRVAALKDAVAKGDFGAVLDEKNAFVLFTSGAYAKKSPADREKSKEATAAYTAVIDAASKKDGAALKAAYAKFMEVGEINADPWSTVSGGQGASGDFDWKQRTDKGYIYVR